MKTYKILGIIFTLFLYISCWSQGDDVSKKEYSLREKITRFILYPFRSGRPFFQSKEKKLAKYLYKTVYSATSGYHVERVQEVLEAGADPNYCRGESGWSDSNPLNVVSQSFYDTYYRRLWEEEIPDPSPDVETLNLLLKAGADINRRPYVWDRVNNWNNGSVESIKCRRKLNGEKYTPKEIKVHIENFVEDSNRILEAFLKSGANVDKLGHPYPYSYEGMKARITDEQANEYFAKGSRAINIAIEKGIVWESQVDLLLQYTELDEESLKVANRSNDPKMLEKINKLWREQQKR